MKNQFAFLFIIAVVVISIQLKAQTPDGDSWIQKADFGGTARYAATGFSIGNKVYIGTGWGGSDFKNDFWEYDPATDVWTQKADFGGEAREFAVGFSIENKGYIGSGNNDYVGGSQKKDFWEYDPATDVWTQKANFGGNVRWLAVGFSIGNKGYIGTGSSNCCNYKNDFWEYDPATDIWTQKADFGGNARNRAIGFSIGDKGYIGTGYDGTTYKDFWEYDPATDTWTQKADFGGTSRNHAVGFSIGSKGYIGTGHDGINYKNDFWEFDPVADTWILKADFGGDGRIAATGISTDSKGYIGTGSGDPFPTFLVDFWEYTPDNSSCPIPTNLSVTGFTESSANLYWDAIAEADQYMLNVWKAVDLTTARKKRLTTNSFEIIEALTPSSTYGFRVKAVCYDEENISPYSDAYYFTTASLRCANTDNYPKYLSVNIYPNPVKDEFTIEINSTDLIQQQINISITNILGEEVFHKSTEMKDGYYSEQININQAPGIYIIKILVAETQYERKVMLE